MPKMKTHKVSARRFKNHRQRDHHADKGMKSGSARRRRSPRVKRALRPLFPARRDPGEAHQEAATLRFAQVSWPLRTNSFMFKE